MTQQTNRLFNKSLNKNRNTKSLPNSFIDNDKRFINWFIASVAFHIGFCVLFFGFFGLLELLNLRSPLAQRPEWKTKDLEFVLTANEGEPIDKNTKNRSDKNSRAGGINDPNKVVSMPSPSPSPAPAPASKPQVQKQVIQKQPAKQPAVTKQPSKPVQTPAETPKPAEKPQPAKPAKSVAPVQRPVLKPSAAPPKAQVPKLATAPSSPFQVEVPKSSSPVGKGFSASSGSASTGGTTGAQSSYNASGTGSGMPAPQFSTTRTASAGGSKASAGAAGRGGYGTGNMGNPGPGNPNGAPGIDAIKSPQWGPYMRELEAKIKRNWHPPKGDTSKRVVLIFKIGKRGELLSTRVSKTSGSDANDQAAIQAVQMSAPFRALPQEYSGPSVEIEFTFDYNVLGANYRR